MRSKLISIIIIVSGLLSAIQAWGAPLSVTAKLDSVNLLMGNMTDLRLEVVQDEGVKGSFPLFEKGDRAQGYVGVCGDSIELRTSITVDTVRIGSGRIQLNYKVPVQAFDSGTFRLPQFVYVSESDSARSNVLTLNVVPVQVTAEDEIAGFAGVADPEGKEWTDIIPDWLSQWWWLIAIILALLLLFAWSMMRYKKEGVIIPRKPRPSPYDEAIKALRELKAKNLWEQGLEREYFTQLTKILRVYLDRRFGINAMEMTSREIMDRLSENQFKDQRAYVRQILNVADFVKFAKVRPLPADNIQAYDNAVKFVEETKPMTGETEDAHPGYEAMDEFLRNPPGGLAPKQIREAYQKALLAREARQKKGGDR